MAQIRVVIRTIDWTTLDDGARTKIVAAIVVTTFYFVLTGLSENARKGIARSFSREDMSRLF